MIVEGTVERWKEASLAIPSWRAERNGGGLGLSKVRGTSACRVKHFITVRPTTLSYILSCRKANIKVFLLLNMVHLKPPPAMSHKRQILNLRFSGLRGSPSCCIVPSYQSLSETTQPAGLPLWWPLPSLPPVQCCNGTLRAVRHVLLAQEAG